MCTVSKNVGYHTRLYGNNAVKCTGGSFGGSLDLETANRLVNAHFTVVAKPSGTLVFVDRDGREVSLYISIDPIMTDAGKRAKEAYLLARRAEQDKEESKREQIETLLDGMSLEEALRRLT